jgi:hypothetical protein
MFCTEYNIKEILLYVDVSKIPVEEKINTLSAREQTIFILIYKIPNVNFISPFS